MKKWILVLLPVVIALLALGGWLAYRHYYEQYYESTFIIIGETEYRRDVTELDFSGGKVPELYLLAELTQLQKLDLRDTGLKAADYDWLRQRMPQCQILWNVPFQKDYLEEGTTALTVTALSAEDVERLRYFPDLERIDAIGCRDYETLMALENTWPELEILYTVPIGGVEYRENTAELTLENADGEELLAMLPYLPKLTAVTLTGIAPEQDLMSRLMELRPDVKFYWNFTVCGVETSSDATELILNEIPMESTEEVEEALKFFHNLTWVEMCDCGISSEDMDAMQQRHPQTRFVWKIKIREASLRTDITAFIPWTIGYSIYRPLYDADFAELKYCVDLICLDLGHMKITDYSFLEYMPNMQYLMLGDTLGSDLSMLADLKELVYLEIFKTGFYQTEVLLNLTKLEDLNVGFTTMENPELLKQMTWLERLWLPGTGISNALYEELVEALPDTQVVYYTQHSTTGGWRKSENYYTMRDLLGMYYMD